MTISEHTSSRSLRQSNVRTTSIRAVAKANKLDLEIVDTDTSKAPLSLEYLKLNKLGRIPSFVGADGYELTECIAIAIYSAFPSPCSLICSLIHDEKHLKNSYPCLKTTVEIKSHSDSILPVVNN